MSDLLHPTAGRRILAGNLSNYYAGVTDSEQCLAALSDLADFADREGDAELHSMCARVWGELHDGGSPSLEFPGYEIDPVAVPEGDAVLYDPEDFAEAEAAKADAEWADADDAKEADAAEADDSGPKKKGKKKS